MYRSITKRVSRIIIVSALVAVLLVALPGLFFFLTKIRQEALDYEERITEELMNQVDNKIDVLSREAERIFNDSEFQRLYAACRNDNQWAINHLSLVLNGMVNASYANGIHSIVIKTENGMTIDSIVRIYSKEYDVDEEYLNHHRYYLSKPVIFEEGGNVRNEIRYVTPIKTGSGPKGFLILNIDLASFESTFLSASNISDRYFWLGYDNTTIYPAEVSYEKERMREVISLCEERKLSYQESFYKDHVYTMVRFSTQGNIKLVTDLSRNTLYRSYRWILIYYIVSILIIIAIILVASLPVLLKRLKPLSRLTEHMMKTSKETEIRLFPTLYTKDETERLTDAFNTMAASINEKNELALQHEKDQAKMRFSLLASQINPHFVYNTLNILTYLARQKRNEEIISVNQALIRILKDTLRVNEKEVFDTVEHEIGIVNQYILIQKYRYGSSFDVEYQADETARSLMIPKNMLQPLVENALFHGLVPVLNDDLSFWGKILVSITYDAAFIRISVSDNGIGMDEEQLDSVRNQIDGTTRSERGRHVALRNIYDRICQLYGLEEPADGLSIQSVPKEGTTVVLILQRQDSSVV